MKNAKKVKNLGDIVKVFFMTFSSPGINDFFYNKFDKSKEISNNYYKDNLHVNVFL
jgi:hypothetical protein